MTLQDERKNDMYTLKNVIFNDQFLMIIEKIKFQNVQTFHFFSEEFLL